MKMVIFGNRKFDNYPLLKRIIEDSDFYKHSCVDTIISGAARGADTLGEKWAKEQNLGVVRMPAQWDKYGKAAGPIRNKEMAEIADCAIGFWDGNAAHSGTNHMINICMKLKVPLVIYRTDTQEITKVLYDS